MPAKKLYALALAAAAMTAIAAVSNTTDAEARSYPICKPFISASATSTGMFGKGTVEARRIARYNFEASATDRYGFQYGNLAKARNVRWWCKKGAILQAECTVTARPCHQ